MTISLEQRLRTAHGMVVRLTEQIGTGIFIRQLREDTNWGIIDSKRGGIRHYLSVRTPMIMGSASVHYSPWRYIRELAAKHTFDRKKDLYLLDPQDRQHPFGICAAVTLMCTPQTYDRWLIRVLKRHGLRPVLNQHQYKNDLNARMVKTDSGMVREFDYHYNPLGGLPRLR